jgi:hypothetical protein
MSFARGYSRHAMVAPGTFNIVTGIPYGLREVLAEGTRLEDAARGYARDSLGETIIESQFQRGAAMRGFDFLSFTGTGSNSRLFINEVKNVTGRARGSKFTVFGLGWGGSSVFDKALDQAQRAISNAGLDKATTDALLRQLRPGGNAAIRLIGNAAKKTHFAPSVLERIRHATGFIVGEGFSL